MRPVTIHPLSILAGGTLLLGLGGLMSMQKIHAQRIQLLTTEEREILSHMSIVYLNDGYGNLVNKTIRITGVNVQLVNGLDATNGYPADPASIDPQLTQINGVGNLIVGYNEVGSVVGDDRTGSHNVVVGHGASYFSFGGMVTAMHNAISAPYATVTGGHSNVAGAEWSSISGGSTNTTNGTAAAVLGGHRNVASGEFAVVAGGFNNASDEHCSAVAGGISNWAREQYSWIGGGFGNLATGRSTSVSGGFQNEAQGEYSSVGGGRDNLVTGVHASISGGFDNDATGESSSVSGGIYNTASGRWSSVTGGEKNNAMGLLSTVSGGLNRSCRSDHDWRAGGCYWCDD
jgi:hypothetical protein